MEKKPLSYFVPGVLLGLISVVLFLVYYFLGQTFKRAAINFLPAALFIGLIIYFIIKWSNDNDNNITFGQAFGYGFKIVMITSLIVFVFTLVFILAFPDFKTQYIDSIREQMNSNAGLSDEQREKALDIVGGFFMISILGGGLFMNLLIGAIASLIGAAVAKKKPQTPFAQQM
jgi:hypothetical protein